MILAVISATEAVQWPTSVVLLDQKDTASGLETLWPCGLNAPLPLFKDGAY